MTAEVVGERPPLGVRLWLALRFAAGPVSAHCSCGWCQESRSLAWRLRLRAGQPEWLAAWRAIEKRSNGAVRAFTWTPADLADIELILRGEL